jgi:hypothetical protein
LSHIHGLFMKVLAVCTTRAAFIEVQRSVLERLLKLR